MAGNRRHAGGIDSAMYNLVKRENERLREVLSGVLRAANVPGSDWSLVLQSVREALGIPDVVVGLERLSKPESTDPVTVRPDGSVCSCGQPHCLRCGEDPVIVGYERAADEPSAAPDEAREIIEAFLQQGDFSGTHWLGMKARAFLARASEPPSATPIWSLVDEYLRSYSLSNDQRGALRHFAGWADTSRAAVTKEGAQ